MGWRLAGALEQLRSEVRAVYPGTTFWTIGDQEHQGGPSDHNPNQDKVVCAADVLGDRGLPLSAFAEAVRRTKHPAFKYVIYNKRIASAGGKWKPYHGDNPHLTHVHISVGVGPDGQSTGPYDDRSKWNVVEGDDVSAKDVWNGYFIDKIDQDSGSSPRMRPESYLAWNHEYAKQQLAQGREILAGQAALLAAVRGDDVEAIRAVVADELAKAASSERTERATEAAALVDELRELMSGGATADQVMGLIAERLAA